MDMVSVSSGEPFPGECVEMTFADDEGGEPHEVVARVLEEQAELICILSGGEGEAVWNPGTAQECSYPATWAD